MSVTLSVLDLSPADLEAAVVDLKAKAVRDKFEDTFVNGDTATDAKAFDGVDKLTASGQTVSMGTNGATLSLDKLDELIDAVKGGKPHLLLVSRRSRRKLGALSRATGAGVLETDRQCIRVLDKEPRVRRILWGEDFSC